MENNRNRSDGWKLWLRWILASVVGCVVGIGLSLATRGVLGEILSSITFGVAVGLAQWFVLRKEFRVSGWWVLVTILGAPLGFAATSTIHRALLATGVPIINGFLGFVALGLVVGSAQWWVLQRYLRRAGWWVLATVAGWSIGGYVAWMVGLKLFEFIKIVADYAILGIMAGASTGLALTLLKKKPAPPEDKKIDLVRYLSFAGSALIIIILASVREYSIMNPDELIGIPDLGSKPMCSELPALECVGDDPYCAELVLFEPSSGPGYINYPVNGETWDDQYRSYLGRDVVTMIKYASARVACETEIWDYSRFYPLGLGDMSEVDGSTPGTSTGHPDHPWGTHQEGYDIDVAYFQIETKSTWLNLESRWLGLDSNLLTSVCNHTKYGMDVYHCTQPPQLLDPWRTSLFIAYLAENPQLRVIGVDGQIGPVLEAALDQLVQVGWIDSGLRDQIPLAYEVTNEGMGWFRHHHHHIHISRHPR